MANAENMGLPELFAEECRGHLQEMRARLPQLRGEATAPASAAAIGDSLHTLAGAARSVDAFDLEYLCRALERLLDSRSAGDHAAALIESALDLAPQLLGAPGGRVRNQMMALAARCDAAVTASA